MTLQEKADQLIFETKIMRDLQRQYFTSRNSTVLSRAKLQEAKVDQLIKDYAKPDVIVHEEQSSLFEGLR